LLAVESNLKEETIGETTTKNSNSLIAFLAFITIALSIVSCATIDPQKDLGHPVPADVSIKWSQLKEGMNINKVIALLGTPPHLKSTSNTLTWGYPFGIVIFEGISSKFGGTDGRLRSWERR
jgi:outer membrane protein assembly factor BamE (lipoprotein component of BamABCDE complex)